MCWCVVESDRAMQASQADLAVGPFLAESCGIGMSHNIRWETVLLAVAQNVIGGLGA